MPAPESKPVRNSPAITTTAACEECPADSFKSARGQAACEPCPASTTTLGVAGSTDASACVCHAGHYAAAAGSADRIVPFYFADMARRRERGETFDAVARDIAETLPDRVYVSFDIDGLDPSLCPHTGTPVPGGLSLAEADAVLRAVVASGRRIVGFDLCEVAPGPVGEWDANVGARVLLKLISCALASQHD